MLGQPPLFPILLNPQRTASPRSVTPAAFAPCQAAEPAAAGFPLLPSPPSRCLWSPAPRKSHRASASCKGGKGGAELGVRGSGEGVPRESGSRLHCEASFTVSRHQLPSCHGNSQLGLPGGSGEVSRDMGVVEDAGGERRGGMFLANVRC